MKRISIPRLPVVDYFGLVLAIVIGVSSYLISKYSKNDLADALLIAMFLGLIVNFLLGEKKKLSSGFILLPMRFIPLGVVFYGLKSLNFVKYSKVNPYISVLLLILILVYYVTVLMLGRLLKQKSQITYLTATGSAICGASAIAMTAPVIESDSDDVSISLLSVAIAGIFGVFMWLPFLSVLLKLNNHLYALFSAAVLQFTGFVKFAVVNTPPLTTVIPAKNALDFALSVKAIRYLGLLIAVPLFATLKKKKLTLPWYLWAFLGAGVVGSIIYARDNTFYDKMMPAAGGIYNILWATAMGAIGLNMNVKKLLSNEGIKALIMAIGGFVAASAVFLMSFPLFISK